MEAPWTIVDPPDLRIGAGSDDPSRRLYRVAGAVRLSDGTLVIAEGGLSELRWFGRDGGHLRTTRGTEGPNALVLLAGIFLLGGDSIAVLDRRFRRISFLDREGTFLGRTVFAVTRELPHPEPIMRFLDGSYFVLPRDPRIGDAGPTRIERLPLNVFRYLTEPATYERMATLEGREVVIGPTGGWYPGEVEPIGRSSRPFGRTTAVAADRTRWIVGNNDRYELDFRTPGGTTTLLARRSVKPRAVTAEDIEADRRVRLQRYGHPILRQRVAEAMERWPDPPPTMPAFGAEMKVDREGNLWVREYAAPEEERNDWSVFDESGVWLGVVTLPEGESILFIGGGHLLTSRETERGGVWVSLFRIDKP